MFGELENLTSEKIKFGKMGMTRMMCINNMQLEGQYTKAMNNVDLYLIENRQLILKDTTGSEILRFKKVD